MRITYIRVQPMGLPAERVRWTAQEITRRVELTLVEVRTDAGIVGVGEISTGPQAVVCKLLDDIAPIINGMDPLEIDVAHGACACHLVGKREGTGFELHRPEALGNVVRQLIGSGKQRRAFRVEPANGIGMHLGTRAAQQAKHRLARDVSQGDVDARLRRHELRALVARQATRA